MARKQKDVFGFDELHKEFDKITKKYPNEADGILMTMGKTALKRTKQLSPTKTKKLRNSWRLRKVKLYKGGKVRVVRVASTAPHVHLIEYGHNIYRGTGRGVIGKRSRQRIASSANGNRTTAVKMLEKGLKETEANFYKAADKMIDNLTKEIEV